MCYVMQSCLSGLEVLLTLFQPEGADYAYYATASTSGFEVLCYVMLPHFLSKILSSQSVKSYDLLCCVMICYAVGCCELSHVIFLKLRKKELLAKL
jgi:hypothetical protein